MNLEQMKEAHAAQAAQPTIPRRLGPVMATQILPAWLEDTIQDLRGADIRQVSDDEFEDLDDDLEASLTDLVEVAHQAMDLLAKYGQRRPVIDLEVKKEFVEMAQKIFETLDQHNLLEETHR